MKRWISFLSLLLVCLMLGGCKRLYPVDSLYVNEHNAPYAFKETTQAVTEPTEPPVPTATDYYGLRNIMYGFVTGGVEHGQIYVPTYEGKLEEDLKKLVHYLTAVDPVAAYATDYINCERSQVLGNAWMISMDAVYRRSVSEIEAISPVRGDESAVDRMVEALRQQESSITLQVSGYLSENFKALIEDYAYLHPDEIVQIPEITVNVYPDSGNVRIVEVHYVYSDDRETLRRMRDEVQEILESAASYSRYGRTDMQKIQQLYSFLIMRFSYRESRNASVYTLLCSGVGNSRCAAALVRHLCLENGVGCEIVQGTKDGRVWYWNIVSTSAGYRHIDFQTDGMNGDSLSFRTDDRMQGYEWNRLQYPACEKPAAPHFPIPPQESESEPTVPPETDTPPEGETGEGPEGETEAPTEDAPAESTADQAPTEASTEGEPEPEPQTDESENLPAPEQTDAD